MVNWKEIVGALLGVLTAILWLGFALAGFPLFPAIAITIVLGVLGVVSYGKSAQNIIKNKKN